MARNVSKKKELEFKTKIEKKEQILGFCVGIKVCTLSSLNTCNKVVLPKDMSDIKLIELLFMQIHIPALSNPRKTTLPDLLYKPIID